MPLERHLFPLIFKQPSATTDVRRNIGQLLHHNVHVCRPAIDHPCPYLADRGGLTSRSVGLTLVPENSFNFYECVCVHVCVRDGGKGETPINTES